MCKTEFFMLKINGVQFGAPLELNPNGKLFQSCFYLLRNSAIESRIFDNFQNLGCCFNKKLSTEFEEI